MQALSRGVRQNASVTPTSPHLPAPSGVGDTLPGDPTLGPLAAIFRARVERWWPDLIDALDGKLARAGGLAVAALLAGVVYRDGRRGHLLALLDAAEGAEAPLARAMREALVFSGIEAGELDVVFLTAESPVASAMARVALRFDLPEPQGQDAAPAAPGMDPSRPPKLR